MPSDEEENCKLTDAPFASARSYGCRGIPSWVPRMVVWDAGRTNRSRCRGIPSWVPCISRRGRPDVSALMIRQVRQRAVQGCSAARGRLRASAKQVRRHALSWAPTRDAPTTGTIGRADPAPTPTGHPQGDAPTEKSHSFSAL